MDDISMIERSAYDRGFFDGFNAGIHTMRADLEKANAERAKAILERNAANEKQKPKKPKRTLHNGFCSNCGGIWGYDRLKTEESFGFKYFQYCPVCGQAIDWSDV